MPMFKKIAWVGLATETAIEQPYGISTLEVTLESGERFRIEPHASGSGLHVMECGFYGTLLPVPEGAVNVVHIVAATPYAEREAAKVAAVRRRVSRALAGISRGASDGRV
jgi:hypothetical protein